MAKGGTRLERIDGLGISRPSQKNVQNYMQSQPWATLEKHIRPMGCPLHLEGSSTSSASCLLKQTIPIFHQALSHVGKCFTTWPPKFSLCCFFSRLLLKPCRLGLSREVPWSLKWSSATTILEENIRTHPLAREGSWSSVKCLSPT